ncbi:MAG: helix-turn-helix transcriptional regulator [Clostridia bacterium]|nr:helix-turn-helix transcriptional regulator [Clostridia bacterium]
MAMLYERSRSEPRRYLYVGKVERLTFGDHMHSSFELIVVTQGEVHATLSGERYTLRAGQAILVLPHRVHNFSSSEDAENLTVIFSPDYVKEFYSAVHGCDFRNPVFEYANWEALLALRADRPFHCMGTLYGLCAVAYDRCVPVVSKERNDHLVRRISDYLYEHYESDISLDSLARELGYNYCYLSEFINQNFGTNFSTLLSSYRVDLALTLLTTTELSVTEIAGRCGFANTRSFNRAFRKIMGSSPSEFARRRAVHAPDADR